MTLEKATEGIRTRMVSNINAICALAIWLQENPNCRWDIRRDRLDLWCKLERECARLEVRWREAREKWLKVRTSKEA
jgi:hypothetical protein